MAMKLAARFLTQCAAVLSCLLVFTAWPRAQNPQGPTVQFTQSTVAGSRLSSTSQENFPPELIRRLGEIKEAALIDDYPYQQLAHLTENIGPRLTGSAGAKAAVEYVAARMRDLGLDVHLEECKVRHWVRGAEIAALVDYPGRVPGAEQKIVLTALGGSTSTGADGVSADLIVVSNFDQLKNLGRETVKGKIVLFNEGFNKQKADAGLGVAAYREAVPYRETGPKAAAELGALAALVRSIGGADYRLPHTGDSDPAGIPAAAVAAEDAELMAHLAAEGPVRMHLVLTPQKLPEETSYNVIGDLRGSEYPGQIVIVSGHLDSWDLGTGALDDGAGVVVAMESAHLLQRLHLRPRRTLRVVAWMDEESDGSGSSQYKKDHPGKLTDHIAAIESDIGAAHPFGFASIMSKGAAETLKPVQEVLGGIGANILDNSSRPAGITDIAPLSEEGVPVLGLMQDSRSYYNYHHTSADTLDKIVPSELRENAAAMAVMAYALAEMTNPLPR
jgi:hypothetical protein